MLKMTDCGAQNQDLDQREKINNVEQKQSQYQQEQKEQRTQHQVHNVSSDGNCFYNSVYKCIRTNGTLRLYFDVLEFISPRDKSISEVKVIRQTNDSNCKTSVKKLRQFVADKVLRDLDVHNWIESLCKLMQELPELISDYPFLDGYLDDSIYSHACDLYKALQQDKNEFLKNCAIQILKDKAWASEIECKIMAKYLKRFDVEMIVIDAPNLRNIVEECDIEMQLHKYLLSIASPDLTRCLVMIHVRNHYCYMSCRKQTVPFCIELLNYLHSYLQDSDDESF